MMINRGASLFAIIYWILFSWGFSLTFLESLLLFSFLCIVPWTLKLVEKKDRYEKKLRSCCQDANLGLLFAILGSFAFVVGPEWLSSIFALVWLLYTVIIALYGASRLFARGWAFSEETAIDIGLMYLALGGVWFLIYELGYNILEFGSTIILLTAIHFHYSAFVVPIFVGLLGRLLPSAEKKQRGYKWIVWGAVISPMGVALGITFSRTLELIFVVLFVLTLWRYAWLIFTIKGEKHQRWAIGLLRLSSLTLIVTMLLSIVYAWGRWRDMTIITIPDMVMVHGAGNAFGFVLLGVIGWLGLQSASPYASGSIPFSKIRAKGRVGKGFLERGGYVEHGGKPYRGLVDQLQDYRREDFDPRELHPLIRDFYENTLDFELVSTTRWAKGFSLISKIYSYLSKKAGQLYLLPSSAPPLVVDHELLDIKDSLDGRQNVRAWVRTVRGTQDTVFVALYSQHYNPELKETFMNISLPLPYAQMTGILRLESTQDGQGKQDVQETQEKPGSEGRGERGWRGLEISSLPRETYRGDEGIYLMTKWFIWRLPLHEHFMVNASEDSRELIAIHRMWFLGLPLLTIRYEITKKTRDKGVGFVEGN